MPLSAPIKGEAPYDFHRAPLIQQPQPREVQRMYVFNQNEREDNRKLNLLI